MIFQFLSLDTTAKNAKVNLVNHPKVAPLSAISSTQQSSVLAQGEWLKFAVTKSGIYKITAALLKASGVNIKALDPKNLGIYGYGGGMLPQLNSEPRPVDLPQIPIVVEGEKDGNFDEGDYILFYAEGPDKQSFINSDQRFFVEKNLYSDSSYYFLSLNTTNGKRIETKKNSGNNHPSISSFDDIIYHEVDMSNLLSSGRKWYGERFSTGSSEKFDYTIQDFVTNSNIQLFAKVMSSSYASSSFDFSLNNLATGTLELEGVPEVDLKTGVNLYAIKGNESKNWFTTPNISMSDNTLSVGLTYNGTPGTGSGYLDAFLIQLKRALIYRGQPFLFSSIASLNATAATYKIENKIAQTLNIWDVTNAMEPSIQSFSQSEGAVSFGAITDTLRKFAVFDLANLSSPQFSGKVQNQNLRGSAEGQLLIITFPSFMPEAQRLAKFKQEHDHLQVTICTPAQIYNEFSSGRQDVSAIRDYVKYLYDNGNIQYLLLLGKCSYAYKDLLVQNYNFVPTYESYNSLHPVETYSSDDYFGFMDPEEGVWKEGDSAEEPDMEIGIGRLPVKSLEEAKDMVDKIIHYSTDSKNYGPWRNEVVFVADDEDTNTHQEDADKLATKIDTAYTDYHTNKIYLGAFPQNGNSSVETQNAINEAIKKGALIVNYNGHGNENLWAEEKILTTTMINQWQNYDKLPLFVTATCEFGRYDDPLRISGGEQLLLNPKGGAIALVTTSRPVYSNTNFLLNNALYDVIFTKGASGKLRLGDIIKYTKNNSVKGVKNRNFSLLGDPSLQLATPNKKITITKVNSLSPGNSTDTLKALSKIDIKGYVMEDNGQKASNFNGKGFVTIYDKPATYSTLSNNGLVMQYNEQNKVLFRGKASIENGEFEIQFIVPKNIDYKFGAGKLSFYGFDSDNLDDAHIGYTDFVVGGSVPITALDKTPPQISLYMDDESFQSGDLTSSNTVFLAKLKDQSGINISSNALNQDLVATLNTEKTFLLNDFYEADLDSYTEGWITYPINGLEEGNYSIKLKAWDINSNASEQVIKFIVASDAKIALSNVVNYPNPFGDKTTFSIDHNRAGESLIITIAIYTATGELVTELNSTVENSPSKYKGIVWDGTNRKGESLTSGVYIYKVMIRSLKDSSKTQQYKRLVIIK